MSNVIGTMACVASVLLNISPVKDVRGKQAKQDQTSRGSAFRIAVPFWDKRYKF